MPYYKVANGTISLFPLECAVQFKDPFLWHIRGIVGRLGENKNFSAISQLVFSFVATAYYINESNETRKRNGRQVTWSRPEHQFHSRLRKRLKIIELTYIFFRFLACFLFKPVKYCNAFFSGKNIKGSNNTAGLLNGTRHPHTVRIIRPKLWWFYSMQ